MDDTLESVDVRIARGIDWLDENIDKWWERVEMNTLRMDSTCRCVLGQLFAEDVDEWQYAHNDEPYFGAAYWYALEQVIDLESDEITREDWAVEHAFDAGHNESYDELGAAWATVIETRRVHA